MSNTPSRPLMVILALSILTAAYVYGRPLIAGDDDVDDVPSNQPDLGFVEEEVNEVAPWTPPADPRNPFLQIELETSGGEAEDDLGLDGRGGGEG